MAQSIALVRGSRSGNCRCMINLVIQGNTLSLSLLKPEVSRGQWMEPGLDWAACSSVLGWPVHVSGLVTGQVIPAGLGSQAVCLRAEQVQGQLEQLFSTAHPPPGTSGLARVCSSHGESKDTGHFGLKLAHCHFWPRELGQSKSHVWVQCQGARKDPSQDEIQMGVDWATWLSFTCNTPRNI